MTFPYKCLKCGAIHTTLEEFCDKCGTKNSLVKTTKKDYKKYYEKGDIN